MKVKVGLRSCGKGVPDRKWDSDEVSLNSNTGASYEGAASPRPRTAKLVPLQLIAVFRRRPGMKQMVTTEQRWKYGCGIKAAQYQLWTLEGRTVIDKWDFNLSAGLNNIVFHNIGEGSLISKSCNVSNRTIFDRA